MFFRSYASHVASLSSIFRPVCPPPAWGLRQPPCTLPKHGVLYGHLLHRIPLSYRLRLRRKHKFMFMSLWRWASLAFGHLPIRALKARVSTRIWGERSTDCLIFHFTTFSMILSALPPMIFSISWSEYPFDIKPLVIFGHSSGLSIPSM